jgi:mannose-6-phosphate isomerase-like protein (cupin superfamily)
MKKKKFTWKRPLPEVKPPKFVEKRWGSETWFANTHIHDYCGKILKITKNNCSSMHYHLDKHETFYILEGKLVVHLIDTASGEEEVLRVNEGETLEIPQGQPHRLSGADGDVTMIEVSTFHRDNDSYRIHV